MRKIKLQVDTLKVDSFETADGGAAAKGTVHGHDSGLISSPYWNGCDPHGSGESCTLEWLACNCPVPPAETAECG